MKHPTQWFLKYSQNCATITIINIGTFSSPLKRNPLPIRSLSPSLFPRPSPSFRKPLICVLSPWIYLFWIVHINGITLNAVFSDLPLSLSIMFSSSTNAVGCCTAAFLLLTYTCLYNTFLIHFVYPSPVDDHLVCFHFLAIMKNASMNTDGQVFM